MKWTSIKEKLQFIFFFYILSKTQAENRRYKISGTHDIAKAHKNMSNCMGCCDEKNSDDVGDGDWPFGMSSKVYSDLVCCSRKSVDKNDLPSV